MRTARFFEELRGLGIPLYQQGFDDYLRDESRFTGYADGLVRVVEAGQVVDVLRLAGRWDVPLTVVSGKTSLTGAAVPTGGVVVDVRGLNRIDPVDPSRVQPGLILKDYKEFLRERELFFPPDPTSEDSCTLGGNVACNASGALSYLYGPTREHVRGLTIALASGRVLDIERGDVKSVDGSLTVPARLMRPPGATDLVIPAPRKGARPWHVCKSAAGLYSANPMDLVDLFIGCEGILGIILEIRTVLRPARNPDIGILVYLPSRERALDLVALLDLFKRCTHDREDSLEPEIDTRLHALAGRPVAFRERFGAIVPSCMEWFDSSVSGFLSPGRARRLQDAYGCLYVEQEYEPHQDPLEVASQWADLVELANAGNALGSGAIETEVALNERQIRELREDRKAIPEGLNEMIRPGMVKIGMDFAVPFERLGWLMELYDEVLPPGKSYIFGHIGNAHLHVNIVPETPEEEVQFRELSLEIAREVCRVGGSISGEHGIGKLKRAALEMMLGADGIDEIARIKSILDPHWILNVNTMLERPARLNRS